MFKITQMEKRLLERFEDSQVKVIDLTGTQDHFEVQLSCPALSGLSRIDQHKAVMAVFSAELKSGEIHALSLRINSLPMSSM